MERNEKRGKNVITLESEAYNSLKNAQIIKNFMMPIIPIKVLPKDWKCVQYFHYYFHNKGKAYNIETHIEEDDDERYYFLFSTKKEKFLFPISYARYSFRLNSLIKYIFSCLSLEDFKTKNSKEYIDSVRDKYIDKAILIWIKNSVTGVKTNNLMHNNFKEILDTFEKINIKQNLVGFVIDKKNPRMRITDIKFIDILNNNYSAKDCLVYKINQKGEIIEECVDYKENSVKGVLHYNILDKEVSQFLNICSYNTEKENQAYIAMASLKNSDIVLVDTGKIEFIKRKGKWYNVSYVYFRYSLKNALENLPDIIIRQLYFNILKACMNDKELTVMIVHPEDTKEYKEIINFYNKQNFTNLKFQALSINEQYDTLLSNDLLSISEEGKLVSKMMFNDFKNVNDNLIERLSNYGLIIKVRKDYDIQMYEREYIIYNTK